jgi:hypothetical protein
VFEQPLAGGGARCNLGQPDCGFNRFDLAKERADAGKLVAPPMFEQASGLGRDLPLARIRPGAPLSDVSADFVDDRGRVVLLFLRRKSGAFVENDVLLAGGRGFPLFRLRDRRDEFGAAADIEDLLRRLAVAIELPMPLRALVGRVQNRVLEEGIGRKLFSSPPDAARLGVRLSIPKPAPASASRPPGP